MRVLHVIDSLGRGGAERVVTTLALEQILRHDVTVAMLHGPNHFEAEVRARRVRIVDLGVRNPRNPVSMAAKLGSLLNQLKPEVVHAHLLFATLAVGLSPGSPSSRRIVTFHNEGFDALGRLRVRDEVLKRTLGAVVRRRFNLATAVSLPAAASYQKHLRLTGQPTVVNNPIDVEGLRARALPRGDARRQLALSGEHVLVVPAKLTVEKDHKTLFRALAQLPRGCRPLVVLLGDGPLRGELRQLARWLEIEASLRWEGEQPFERVLAWYRAADLVALSSRSEGMPMVLLEALALGVPVVATRVGAIPEMLGELGGGVLVPPGDPTALAAALAKALNDAPLDAPRHLTAFTPATVVARWDDLYAR